MILKSKLSCLWFLIFFGLLSCSEKSIIDRGYFLDVSDQKEFFIGEGGLTNEGYHMVFLDSFGTQGTIYNPIAHSLDSIFISPDSAWSKDGDIMDIEGPYGVGTVFSFFSTLDFNLLINSQEFFRQDIKTKEVSRKFLHEYGVFGDLEYPAIAVSTSTREFTGLDKRTNTGYFIYDHKNRISVIGYNVDEDSMFVMPVKLDSASFFNRRFKVKSKNLIMGGGDEPQLSVLGSKLIVSYPSFSDILVYDLSSGRQETFTSLSNSYPGKKILPENYSEEVESFDLLDEWLEFWRKQVRFGSISFLEDQNVYVRVVKGEGLDEAPLFLEVFDLGFQKVSELNLSEINQNSSSTFVKTGYGLLFRAKDQPVEDVMYYYYVNLNKKK